MLQTPDNELISDSQLLDRIRENIDRAVTGTLKPQAALRDRWRSLPQRVRHLPVPARVILSNKIKLNPHGG